MYLSLSVLYVCVLCVPALARKSGMSRHQLELKEHYEHLAKIAEFECDLPQPRLLTVSELLSDFQMRGKAYFPEVTILHRCDRHTGSCNDAAHKCGPTQATPVNMPFKVTFLEAMAGHAKGEWEMEYHSLENHTSCGCLKSEGLPPTKMAVHYHYVDPALMPPLPLEPHTNPSGNATSYEVPVYQEPSTPNCNDNVNGPSICDMTKTAEDVVRPESSKVDVDGKPEGGNDAQYQGYGGYPSSEPSTGNEVSPSSPKTPTDECSSCDVDGDATTIPADLLRFGAEEGPRSEALKAIDLDSPYDAYLKQAFS